MVEQKSKKKNCKTILATKGFPTLLSLLSAGLTLLNYVMLLGYWGGYRPYYYGYYGKRSADETAASGPNPDADAHGWGELLYFIVQLNFTLFNYVIRIWWILPSLLLRTLLWQEVC